MTSPLASYSRLTRARASVRSAAAWALICLSVTAHPVQSEQRTAKIVGLGATTCSRFTQDIEQKPGVQRDYLAWAQGFMSGILLSRPPGIDESLDLNPPIFGLIRQLEFLRNYCVQRPAKDFSDAVVALYERLRKEGTT
jgi:hypothetical protein